MNNKTDYKKIFKYGLFLSLIGVFVGGILGITYFVTKPYIDNKELEEVINYLNDVDNTLKWEHDKNKYEKIENLYLGKKDNNVLLYAFKTKTLGYNSGEIDSLIFIEDEKIKKIKIIKMTNQTSGIGTKIADEEYLNKFINDKVDKYVNKDITSFSNDVISGATISSNALIQAIINSCTVYKLINYNNLIITELNKYYPNIKWESYEKKKFAKDAYYNDENNLYAYICEKKYLLYGDYYGELKIIVFIKEDKIDEVTILYNSQTSEYGIKINEPSYLNLYKGKEASFYANKNINEFDAEIITSSTITSQAFVNLVIMACSDYINLGE